MSRGDLIKQIMEQVREALPDDPKFCSEVERRLNLTTLTVLRELLHTNAIQEAELKAIEAVWLATRKIEGF